MKILLLTLYYPPMNMSAANRMRAFVRYMEQAGHDVTVMTRFYDTGQRQKSDLLIADSPPEHFNHDYIVQDKVIYCNYSSNSREFRFFKLLPPLLKGIYNYSKIDVYHYGWIPYVLKAYEKEMSGKKFDFIISSAPPFIAWVAGRLLSERTGTPWIADMRDSFVTDVDRSWHPKAKGFFFSRLFQTVHAILYVSDGMKNYVEKNIPSLQYKPSALIYNGIDPPEFDEPAKDDASVVEQFNELKQHSSLLLLHTGSLYPKRNLDNFVQWVITINNERKANAKPVRLVCLGLQDDFIRKYTCPDASGLVFFPGKSSFETSVYLQKRADALVLPVWENGYTEFSGKVFEYLYSDNICLVSPKPKKDLSMLLNQSPNIYYMENYQEFKDFVTGLLKEKIAKKHMNDKKILLRSYYVDKLNDFLKEISPGSR